MFLNITQLFVTKLVPKFHTFLQHGGGTHVVIIQFIPVNWLLLRLYGFPARFSRIKNTIFNEDTKPNKN